MNTELMRSTLDDAYKCQIFEQIAGVVTKLDNTAINLQEKGYNVYRDALAFLVEGMSTLYSAEQAKIMLNGVVERITACVQKKTSGEARLFLDEQISTIYEAVLVDTIKQKPEEEKRNWEAISRMYAAFRSLRAEEHKNGNPAEFGGINQSLLPTWYKTKYVDQ